VLAPYKDHTTLSYQAGLAIAGLEVAVGNSDDANCTFLRATGAAGGSLRFSRERIFCGKVALLRLYCFYFVRFRFRSRASRLYRGASAAPARALPLDFAIVPPRAASEFERLYPCIAVGMCRSLRERSTHRRVEERIHGCVHDEVTPVSPLRYVPLRLQSTSISSCSLRRNTSRSPQCVSSSFLFPAVSIHSGCWWPVLQSPLCWQRCRRPRLLRGWHRFYIRDRRGHGRHITSRALSPFVRRSSAFRPL
jgi:hypothetical protein